MTRDEQGDKHFDSAGEACAALRDSTVAVVRWLHFLQDEYRLVKRNEDEPRTDFPMFRAHRTVLNDLSNVTQRLLRKQEAEINGLREKLAAPAR